MDSSLAKARKHIFWTIFVVYEAIKEGTRLDIVYLDFAKAFDKVDHNVLIRKLAENKIKGKLGRWIKEFLKDRKFRVVANEEMSKNKK